jgi:hypothetical protein
VTWKGELGEGVEREGADFEHLSSGRGACPVDQPAAVRDDDKAGRADFGDVVDADQPGHLD